MFDAFKNTLCLKKRLGHFQMRPKSTVFPLAKKWFSRWFSQRGIQKIMQNFYEACFRLKKNPSLVENYIITNLMLVYLKHLEDNDECSFLCTVPCTKQAVV
jgi:hypothetical protein